MKMIFVYHSLDKCELDLASEYLYLFNLKCMNVQCLNGMIVEEILGYWGILVPVKILSFHTVLFSGMQHENISFMRDICLTGGFYVHLKKMNILQCVK